MDEAENPMSDIEPKEVKYNQSEQPEEKKSPQMTV